MKMKSVLIVSAMMAVGMVGTASAGVEPPLPTPGALYCGDEPVRGCLNGDWVEVELKCNDDYEGWFYVGEIGYGALYNWDLNVWVENDPNITEDDVPVCVGLGGHSLMKTEGKCTDQMKGPTKGNKNKNTGGFTGDAVEYEIKTVKENAPECKEVSEP